MILLCFATVIAEASVWIHKCITNKQFTTTTETQISQTGSDNTYNAKYLQYLLFAVVT